MVIIGIDPHSTTHVAAAVDAHGQLLGSIQVGASPQQLQGLAGWVGGFQGPRLVAVEGARGYGLALTRVLVAAGERVVDVAPALTAAGRRRGRARGKDDRIDAVAIARLARQEPGLPALSLVGLNADLSCWSTPVTSWSWRPAGCATGCTRCCWSSPPATAPALVRWPSGRRCGGRGG